jgi:hypothetical protein
MSKKCIIKRVPYIDSGEEVKVDEECRIPDGLALSMERKGMCVIITDGVRADASADDHEVERDTLEAKKAVKSAEAAKKRRDAAKAKANKGQPSAKPIPKKATKKKAAAKKPTK